MEWEDLDLCWRAWLRGWPSVYVPGRALRHRVGAVTTAGVAEAAGVVAPQPDALRAQVPAAGAAARVRRRRAAAPAAAPACVARRWQLARELPEIRAARRELRPSRELFEWMLAGQAA